MSAFIHCSPANTDRTRPRRSLAWAAAAAAAAALGLVQACAPKPTPMTLGTPAAKAVINSKACMPPAMPAGQSSDLANLDSWNATPVADASASSAGGDDPPEENMFLARVIDPEAWQGPFLAISPSRGPLGPNGPVFNHCGNRRQIVFLCDASTSMINKVALLKTQLTDAVMSLRPVQSFDVIFMQGAKCAALDASLLPATPKSKDKLSAFLDHVAFDGPTNPLPAIDMAFSLHPTLIYLLADGDFPDNQAVLKRCEQLLRPNRVKINTIAFVSTAETDNGVEFLQTMKLIAQETGGVFTLVAQDKLER